MRIGRRLGVVWLAFCSAACGGGSTPTAPSQTFSPDEALVLRALEHWKTIVGIDYTVLESNAPPRVLIRIGQDLPVSAAGRGGVTRTDSENWATLGEIVIRPPGTRERTYRHELGHVLGHFAHSDSGLMSPSGSALDLTEADVRMMRALYALPAGTRVEPTGHYVTLDGTDGQLDDVEAAADIVRFNLVAGGVIISLEGATTRWPLPLPVYIQR